MLLGMNSRPRLYYHNGNICHVLTKVYREGHLRVQVLGPILGLESIYLNENINYINIPLLMYLDVSKLFVRNVRYQC